MIAALVASKLGRTVIAYGAVAVGVLVAVWRIFAAGKKSAQVEGMKDQLKNVETHNVVEDSVARAGDDERQWLRDKWTRRS